MLAKATEAVELPSDVFLSLLSELDKADPNLPSLVSSPAVVPLYARRILGARERETQTDETSSRPMHYRRYAMK